MFGEFFLEIRKLKRKISRPKNLDSLYDLHDVTVNVFEEVTSIKNIRML